MTFQKIHIVQSEVRLISFKIAEIVSEDCYVIKGLCVLPYTVKQKLAELKTGNYTGNCNVLHDLVLRSK